MWLIFAVGSAFFAGIMSILAKIGLQNIDSNLATAIRTLVVMILSWILVFSFHLNNQLGNVDIKSLIFLILSGVATGGSWIFYFKALQLGDVNKVAPIDKSSVILTMVLSFILFKEPFTWIQGLSLVFIFIGTYAMIEINDKHNPSGQFLKNKSWFIYACLSAFFASLTAILGKMGTEAIDSNLATAIRTVVILIISWAIVFYQGSHKDIWKIKKSNWLFLVFSGLATGGSWLCYYRALQEGPVSIVVPIDKLSILVTILFSYFVLGEKLEKKALLGLCILILGTLLLLI